MIPNTIIRSDVIKWLSEDIPTWDISSSKLNEDQKFHNAKIIAKEDGVVCGINVSAIVFDECGVKMNDHIDDGDEVTKGDCILTISGYAHNILQAERTVLNILTHLSGIATFTRYLVNKIKVSGSKTKVAATRKTIPGLRKYQKWAVQIGGGDTHRMSLSDMILLKENHIRSYGSITNAVNAVKKQNSFSKLIEVEVTSDEEALEAANAKVDIIMLDNYTPAEISAIIPLIKKIEPEVLIESSGNIDEKNILEYARTGVDIISLGKLTHSVKSLDMSLLFAH